MNQCMHTSFPNVFLCPFCSKGSNTTSIGSDGNGDDEDDE